MSFEFTKMHGAGNDFVVIDNRSGNYSEWTPEFIAQLCAFHTGIGADGLLMLENSAKANFRMRYFNCDGFESDMCANGSRCIGYFAFKSGIVSENYTFEAEDGIHSGKIIDKNLVEVEVLLKNIAEDRTFPDEYKLPDSARFINFLNTGVPHLIIACADIDTIPVNEVGRELRFHPYYQPQGTNVNFIQVDTKNNETRIQVRTFERGVDRETFSCGSGVTAVAISLFGKKIINGVCNAFITQGGMLHVTINRNLSEIFLKGPVKTVFRGFYPEEQI